MFEISGDDIAALSDEDLRALIGRLCEADLRRRNLATSAVTWGGDQNAPDGGLDVRVSLPSGTAIGGFIPNVNTGFQVKKPDMPRHAILAEMKPGGALRPVISKLAATAGAYIIVSANSSTSDTALASRRDAMQEAVAGIPGTEGLFLDFYDQNRVATWVRDHAGLIPWARSCIGKAITGWRAYGSWSNAPAGADPSYLMDGHTRIRTGDKNEGDGVDAAEGISRIRNLLREPGHVVRLVGLSGVGKTRLVEALFDPSIGADSLDPSLAYYTNITDDPDPQPAGLASDLNAARTRAILVVDNCQPQLHRQLSEVARSAGSTISVVTVEYDIREDQPEGTDVFVLDTSSPALIEQLVARRDPSLSQVDARTIATFSGGNARVALALAATVGKTETLAGLSDADLFERLFRQRNESDPSLLSIAQACSLVYSFDGEKLSGDEAELPFLGSVVGKSAEEMYAGVAELKRRDLLQERGPWRAVLPHAIANSLAKLALQNIPPAKVTAVLVGPAPERLFRSFSRRLGYLDDSKEARAIVENWLAPGGLLAQLTDFTELGRAVFSNVAPVCPDAVLNALETDLSGADDDTLKRCKHFVRLLRSLAYDAVRFERAVALLVRFARLPSGHQQNEASSVVESLFHIMLSGTHAPVEMRCVVVDSLLTATDEETRKLGIEALEALLETDHFSSHYEFEFGARSRDYGYYPRSQKNAEAWFSAALALAERHALSGSPVASAARDTISRCFRGLWTNAGQADALERISRRIADKGFWREGWIAARQTRSFDHKRILPEYLARLGTLEEFLRPKNLITKVRGLVLGATRGALDFDDLDDAEDEDYAAARARGAAAIEKLGIDIANDGETFKSILSELLTGDGRQIEFGQALARGAENPDAMWRDILAQYATTSNPNLGLLCGFLTGTERRDAALATAFLDQAFDDPKLATVSPILQSFATLDARGLQRLHKALAAGLAPIASFYNLAWGRTSDNLTGPELRDLIFAISEKSDGMPVALEILSMRLHSDHGDKRATAPEVREAGRVLLSRYEIRDANGRSQREDHELGVVARDCLAGPEGVPAVQRLCRALLNAYGVYELHAHDHDELVKALFDMHPSEVLDELFSGDEKSRAVSVRFLSDLLRSRGSIMANVSDETILAWCDIDPAVRYPLATAVSSLFKRLSDQEPHQWTPLAPELLRRAPDPNVVLTEIIARLRPTSWSGSLATKLQSRLKLLEELPIDDLSDLKPARDDAIASFRKWIDRERQRETEEDKSNSERFE
jgi:hypothetical protein